MREDRYSSKGEQGGLLFEVGRVIEAATEKPKDEAFSFALSAIPDSTLDELLDGSVRSRAGRDDEPAVEASGLLAIGLRSHLHGRKGGGFQTTEDDLIDIVNTVAPYHTIELIRRRGCFEECELPSSPWAVDAAVCVRGPRRDNIGATVAELKRRNIPCLPLLTEQETLQQMEKGTGVVIQLGPRGRGLMTPQMANVQPHKAPALDPQAFVKAFDDVNRRAFSDDGGLAELPQEMPTEVDYEEDGEVRRLNLREMSNSPQGRMVQIMHDHFGHDFEQYRSAILRFNALLDLLRKDALAAWMVPMPEGMRMHPAILITAATLKLTKGGLFPPARFVREVEDLARQQ